jgi:dTDP-4-amino-4,6-dideoxygalactose transaminase
MKNAYGIVAEFEDRVAEYAGSRYAVAVDCCTSAIFLSLEFLKAFEALKLGDDVILPARTYVSVPMACIHAGLSVRFVDYDWSGVYELAPHRIWDGAKRFHRGMYGGGLHCLSFHVKKLVNIGRGGMILTDDTLASVWLRKARYDGRSGKPYAEEQISMLGWHCYMVPEQAARGLTLLDNLPEGLPDQTEDYPDLRKFKIFQPARELAVV